MFNETPLGEYYHSKVTDLVEVTKFLNVLDDLDDF